MFRVTHVMNLFSLRHGLPMSWTLRNNRYSVAEELLALLYPIMLGLGRIETSHIVKHNGIWSFLSFS